MKFRFRSTRARISLVYTATFGIALIAVSMGTWLALASQELSHIDATLTAQLSAVRSSVRHATKGTTSLPELTSNGMVISVVFYQSETVRAYTPEGDRSVALADWVQQNAVDAPTPVVMNAPFDGVRALISVVSSSSVNGTLLLTTPLNTYNTDRWYSALALGGSVALLLIIAALVGYRAAGSALRPVHEITLKARGLSEQNLGEHIAIRAPNDEIGELVTTFDSMLDRLSRAFTVQKRLSANAAHELRTPLAMLRAEIEVTLSKDRPDDEYRKSLASVLVDVGHMSGIVDRLLLVARSEAGTLDVQAKPVDLSDAVIEAAERSRGMAEQRHIHLETETVQRCDACGDASMIRQILDNIVGNALRYTPEGGRIVISAVADVEWATITVDDTGPGIPVEQRAYVLEPFSRLADGRADQQGAGLGLAVCVAIVNAHKGGIDIDESPSGGTLVRVRLPKADVARAGGLQAPKGMPSG
jgi:signal transduction histidine kinase